MTTLTGKRTLVGSGSAGKEHLDEDHPPDGQEVDCRERYEENAALGRGAPRVTAGGWSAGLPDVLERHLRRVWTLLKCCSKYVGTIMSSVGACCPCPFIRKKGPKITKPLA